MDMGDLLKLGATVFQQSNGSGNTGSGLDIGTIIGALSGLTGNSQEGGLDIGSIIGKLTNSNGGNNNAGGGDLMSMAQSWLGDGDNQAASTDSITQMLGQDKLSEFASKLGLSEDEAIGGLKDALPQMVDKSSSGGSLLDSIGGIGGAINLAGKLFGK